MKLIRQGSIKVNDVLLVLDEKDAKAWHIDCASKRFGITGTYGYEVDRHDDHIYEIILYEHEGTLYKDEEHDGATIFELPVVGDEWMMMLDSAKYSAYVVIYRWDREKAEIVWERPGLWEERAARSTQNV